MLFPEALKLLTDILWQVKEDELSDFLEDILTPAEITDFADRLTLLKKLKEWKTQREIAKDMWISVTTVSRWSRVLKYGRQVVSKYL